MNRMHAVPVVGDAVAGRNGGPTGSGNAVVGATRSSASAMLVLALAMLTASLGTSIGNVALPGLAVAWSVPFEAVQWVVVAYLLASTATVVVVGRLGDLVGERRLLLLGLLLVAVAAALGALAPNLPVLVAARAVQGVGASVLMALAVALARSLVDQRRTGAAMGLLGTMSAIGTALGPSLGGALVAAFGWRAAFAAAAPLALVAFAIGLRSLPRAGARAAQRGERFDVAGASLLVGTTTAFALATTGRSLGDWRVAAYVATVFGAIAFVAIERRAASPLLPLAMLRERGLGAALLANAVVSAVMMATLVVGPFHLVHALGLESARAGLVMSVGPLVAALVGVPAGRLVDRLGAPRVALAGLFGVVLGTSLLAALANVANVLAYGLPLAVTTASYAVFSAANNTTVMAGASAGRRGVLSGLASLSRNLGLMSGAAGLGSLFAAACGVADVAVAPPGAIAGAMRFVFFTAATVVLLFAVGVAWRGARGERVAR